MDFRTRILLFCTFLLCPFLAMTAGTPSVVEKVVEYTSVGPRGEQIRLSGKVSVPMKSQPKGLMLIPHFTIGANDEAPSMCTPAEVKVFRDDYVLVMPDYIGFGITRDSIMPYLDGALTARNCVDMLLQVPSVIDSIRSRAYSDTIIIFGFSQGGAAALWTLKLLEEQYADRIHVKACYAGSGPYDVASTYDVAVMTDKVGYAMTIPTLILGTNEAYDLHLSNDYFFTPELQRAYDKFVAPKEKGVLALYFLMNRHRTSYWMTRNGMDKTQPEPQRLYQGLLRSSLVHVPMDTLAISADTVCVAPPKAPTYVFHSTEDDIVTFENARHLQQCWSDAPNVTFDFGNHGSHLRSFLVFSHRVRKILDKQ